MKVAVINIQLLTYIHIIQASVTRFASDGDPIIGQKHQMKCTVSSFGSNVFIYKTSTANIDQDQVHELVCSNAECLPAGSFKYTGIVDGRVITITIPTLTIQENEKYWTCTQDDSQRNLWLKVFSVPSSISLKGPTQTCDLGQRSCGFSCTTDNCTFPSPTFTWLYVFDDDTTEVIPHTSEIRGQSDTCAVLTRKYEDTLTFPQYELFTGNIQKTVRLQCYITFAGLSSGRRTSDVSQEVIFAVKVSVAQIFDGNTEITDATLTVNHKEENLLTCIPGNANPTPTVDWIIGNISVSTTPEFRFIPANSNHGQQIYCAADNIPNNGMTDAMSNKPVLYVKVRIQFVYIEPAADTVISVIEDTPEPVVCITSPGRPGSTIKWYRNNVQLGAGNSTDFEMADNNLEVAKSTRYFKVLRSDSGWTLSCAASNYNGSAQIRANNSKSFNVLYQPEQMSFVLGGKPVEGPVINVIKGNPGTLKCSASSNPPASLFSWNIKQMVGDTLTIDDSIQNGQTVNCTARNVMTSTTGISRKGYGSISKTINLQYGAMIERMEVNGKTGTTVIKEHDPLLIACYVDSNPDSAISLFQGTTRLIERERNVMLNYNISSAQCSHTSQYICRADNGISNVEQPAEETVQVNVECSPRLAFETDSTVFGHENTTAVLSLIVLAYPIPTRYNWYKNSSNSWKELNNTTQMTHASAQMALTQFNLILVHVKPEDYGEYKLTVDNSIGDPLSFTFILKAHGVPANAVDDSIDGSTLAVVAGAMGSALAIVIVIVVILVLIIWRNNACAKGRKQDNLTYEMPNREAQGSEERTYDTVNQSINEYENPGS